MGHLTRRNAPRCVPGRRKNVQWRAMPTVSSLQGSFQLPSPVYHQHVLSCSTVPALTRHVTDLRLLDWNRYGWRAPEPDTSLIFKMEEEDRKRREEREAAKLLEQRQRTDLSLNYLRRNQERDDDNLVLTTRSLPPLPTNGLGQPMLRRPTVLTARPIPEDGDLFGMITKGRELKPFSFQGNPVKAMEFYSSHYPLLLKKRLDRSLPSSAKVITETDVKEHLRFTSAERRIMTLHQKLDVLHGNLENLDHDPEEEPMVTELRHDAFNPVMWPWNADRYTMPNTART